MFPLVGPGPDPVSQVGPVGPVRSHPGVFKLFCQSYNKLALLQKINQDDVEK